MNSYHKNLKLIFYNKAYLKLQYNTIIPIMDDTI